MDQLKAIALLDEPARRRLYDWVVDQNRPVGREEAAAAVGVTRALAAFHLDRLADAGLLASDYRRLNERRGPGAGRPARVYWRPETEFTVSLPQRRYGLAAHLLADALERQAGTAALDAARQAGHDLGEQLGTAARRATPRRKPRERLRTALEEGGYEPTSAADGPVIRLRNCPFHGLVDEHRPLVCGMNLAVAEGLVEGLGEESLVPVLDSQPGFCCVAFTPRGE